MDNFTLGSGLLNQSEEGCKGKYLKSLLQMGLTESPMCYLRIALQTNLAAVRAACSGQGKLCEANRGSSEFDFHQKQREKFCIAGNRVSPKKTLK